MDYTFSLCFFKDIIDHTTLLLYYCIMKIFDYTTTGGKNVITNYIDKLPAGDRAAIYFIRTLIEEDGLLAFDLLDTKPLYKKIHEIRISKERIAYVLVSEERVYFLHIFRKQKGKTELKDKNLAIKRAKEENLL